jgi:hypothetical protein
MIKPLTADLALPLYSELPTVEMPAPDIESDFQTGPENQAYGRLENSLLRPLGEDVQPLYVRG